MKPFKTSYSYEVKDTSAFLKSAEGYLKNYNFQSKEDLKTDSVQYYKPYSLLQGWRFNPLNWESQITFTILNNTTISAEYTVYENSTITPTAFSDLYNGFLSNLEKSFTSPKNFKLKNKQLIVATRKRLITSIVLIILSMLLLGWLGHLLTLKTGWSVLQTSFNLIGIFASRALINKYYIKKYKNNSSTFSK